MFYDEALRNTSSTICGKYSRRDVLAALGAVSSASLLAAGQRSQVAITMDDVAWANIPPPFQREACTRLLSAFQDHGKLHAALFVTGSNVDSAEGRAIVQRWSDQGHMIANHTWSHRMYNNSIEPGEFADDMLRCDQLVRTYSGFRPYFRFPALKEGGTAERRDWMRKFLHEHNYRNGAVTIDASDWYYDQRLRECLTRDASFEVNRFRAPYLAHIWDRACCYDGLARKALGRPIQHTILVHFNLLNTLFLGDLLEMFKTKNWDVVNVETAYRDPVFKREPNNAPAGESLVWALAKETGRFDAELRYPGEDDVYEKPILDRLGL